VLLAPLAPAQTVALPRIAASCCASCNSLCTTAPLLVVVLLVTMRFFDLRICHPDTLDTDANARYTDARCWDDTQRTLTTE
jgi:hypothetical protein